MISELKDEEIMNFLMTSEFEDDYKPEELKYLLFKWRYFYRILHGKHELIKCDSEHIISKLKDENEFKDLKIFELQKNIADKENILNNLKSRKLTYKERLSGKIIIKDDENK